MKRLTDSRYHAMAKERRLMWLGPSVSSANTKTAWRCLKGHQFLAIYAHLYSGRGCPSCAPNKRLTESNFHSAGLDRGITWVGEGLPRSSQLTEWQCKNGHIWKARHSNISRGRNCRICLNRKIATIEDYELLASKRGFTCVTQGRTNHAKTTWGCSLGHQWKATYTQLKATGSGCPTCYKLIQQPAQIAKTRKRPYDYHLMATRRGVSWLGPETLNGHSKTRWQCSDEHSWLGTYSDLYVGQGCPECVDIVNGHRVSKPQRQLCLLLNGELNVRCGRYSIDVSIERRGVQIAVEYDAWYWHAGRETKDKIRQQELIRNGWKVLRIKTNSALPSLEQVSNAIERLLQGEDAVEVVLPDWGVGPMLKIA